MFVVQRKLLLWSTGGNPTHVVLRIQLLMICKLSTWLTSREVNFISGPEITIYIGTPKGHQGCFTRANSGIKQTLWDCHDKSWMIRNEYFLIPYGCVGVIYRHSSLTWTHDQWIKMTNDTFFVYITPLPNVTSVTIDILNKNIIFHLQYNIVAYFFKCEFLTLVFHLKIGVFHSDIFVLLTNEYGDVTSVNN